MCYVQSAILFVLYVCVCVCYVWFPVFTIYWVLIPFRLYYSAEYEFDISNSKTFALPAIEILIS